MGERSDVFLHSIRIDVNQQLEVILGVQKRSRESRDSRFCYPPKDCRSCWRNLRVGKRDLLI